MSDQQSYPGWQDAFAASDHFNAVSFLIRQAMAGSVHVALVLVKAVTASSVAGAPPTVNVQPMVAQVDQTGVAVPHGTIYQLPTFRLQAGASAMVMDPQIGDIGVCLFADRDISSAVANQAPSNPGSFRRFDWADGIYLGGIARINPTQFVSFTTAGITVTTPKDVTVNAASGTVTVNANKANIISNTVNLGATGGPAVARVGDTVSGGVITSGSSKVNCG